MQSKDEIELAVFESFREFLLAVRFFRLRLAVLLGELLDRFSLVHTGVYGAHKQNIQQIKRNKYFIVELKSEEIKIR
jgi:hypothetical protein